MLLSHNLRRGSKSYMTDVSYSDQLRALESQYDDLMAQFHGFSRKNNTDTPIPRSISQPNEPSLSPDFTAAQQLRPSSQTAAATTTATTTSSLKGSSSLSTSIPPISKSVRFTDSPPSTSTSSFSHNQQYNRRAEADAKEAATRAKLFPYRDNYSDEDINNNREDPALSNDQLHAYHSRVIAEQDAQLDQLGASIGRQRELSIRIGDELDEHVGMLEEVDGHVDRQAAQLGRARTRLNRFARSASENKSMTAIVVLIVVLVLLIMITK